MSDDRRIKARLTELYPDVIQDTRPEDRKSRAQVLREWILLYARHEQVCLAQGDMFSFQYWRVKRNLTETELRGMS
jgi:hypothetical protein